MFNNNNDKHHSSSLNSATREQKRGSCWSFKVPLSLELIIINEGHRWRYEDQ